MSAPDGDARRAIGVDDDPHRRADDVAARHGFRYETPGDHARNGRLAVEVEGPAGLK